VTRVKESNTVLCAVNVHKKTMSCVIQFSRYGRYLLQIAIFLPFCAILWIIQKRFREKTSFLTSKARPRGHSRPLSSTNSVI